jgi:ABC-type Na+ efflux pump permease subunit
MYVMYEPLKTFAYLSAAPFVAAMALGLRFLWYYFTVGAPGKVQSLIAMAVLFTLSFLLMVLGILADLIHGSRLLVEDALYRTRVLELRQGDKDRSAK